MKKIVFLYSEDNDPLLREVRPASRGYEDFHFISFDTLAQYFEQYPWPELIRANFSTQILEVFKDAFIVNRVFTISSQSWLPPGGDANALAHFMIEPLMKSGIGTVHALGPRGYSRTHRPLDVQWKLMSNYNSNNVNVPKYVLAIGGEAADLSQFRDPMQKSRWSLYDWKTENHLSENEKANYFFYVERPVGIPIICHYLGDVATWLSFPRGGNPEIDMSIFDPLVKMVKSCFVSSVGEFLTFLEPNGTLRFYAFSPFLEAASGTTEFSLMTKLWIQNTILESK